MIKWLWTFVARGQVLFKIASSRSGEVLRDVLGPVYNGVLGSDCFSAYNTIAAQPQVADFIVLAQTIFHGVKSRTAGSGSIQGVFN